MGRETVQELVVGALRAGAGRLEQAVGMVANGEEDGIHQVRVACRRLRSDLKLFRKFLAGEWATGVRAELAGLAQACGEARDLEVIAALVSETSNSEDNEDHVDTILTTLTVARDRATARATGVVLGESTNDLLTKLHAAPAPTAGMSCAEVLPQLLQSANNKFTRAAGELLRWGPDGEWHQVRLLAKRLRYAADTCAPVLGEEARATAASARRYQDLLGKHQDYCAAADALTAMADDAAAQEDPELSFTLGRLTERHRAARGPLRDQFLAWYHRP